MFQVNSAGVQFHNLEIAGTGARDAVGQGEAIVIGGDHTSVADGAIAATGSFTFTSATGGLTGTEGMRIRIVGAGVGGVSLRTSIVSVNSDTSVQVLVDASTAVTGADAIWGNFYDGCVVNNCNISSHAVAIHIITGIKTVISGNRLNSHDAIEVESLLSGDNGENMIFDNRIQSDDTTGANIRWTSGGGLRIHNNKFLNGKWDIYIDWNYDSSGGFQLVQNHFENGTGMLFVTGDGTAVQRNWNITANTFNGSSAGLEFDDTRGVGWIEDLVISGGNLFTTAAASPMLSIGKSVESFHISGNTFDGQSQANAVGVEVKSGAADGYITSSNMFRNYDGAGAIPVVNADTTTRVEVSHHNDFVTGTAGVGVTVQEEGVGYHHLTKLTLAGVLPAITGDTAEAEGLLIYTFPVGVIVVNSVHMDVSITETEGFIDSDTPFVGIGTVIATGAVSDLTGTAGFDDYVIQKAATNCTGTKTDRSEIPATSAIALIEAGQEHKVHFNAADLWDDTAGGDAAAIVGGEVWISWDYLGA